MMQRAYGSLIALSLVLSACGSTSESPASVRAAAISGSNIDAWRHQVIYLTLPDRFYNGDTGNDNAGQPNCFDKSSAYKFHGGDLAGVRQQLGYVKGLGASALWSTPVYKQVGEVNAGTSSASCGYHGYWADDTDPGDQAIEPKLGTSTDLSGLITDLHSNGMKFIMDMVVNHAGYGARIVSQHPDWFHSNCTGNDVTCPLAGLPDFAQENTTVANYLTGVSKTWTSSYAIDGIRMDTVKHVPTSYWQNSWVPGVLAARPNTFLLGEVFNDSSSSALKPYLDAGFDSVFNFPLRAALVSSVAKAGSLDALAASVSDYVGNLGLDRALLMVNLLDNHDVQRFINEPGLGVAESDIRRRYQLALAALMTLPGIPQLYYGDELGMYGGPDPDNRHDMPSWAWSDAGRNSTYSGFLAGGGTPKATYDYVRKLVGLRQNNEALWKGGYAEMWRPNGGQNVFAFFRGSNASRAVVVMNTSASSAAVSLDLQGNPNISAADKSALGEGTVFSDQLGLGAPASATVSGGKLPLTLPAGSMAVYLAGGSGAGGATSVTFQVSASTVYGQNVYLSGDSAALGSWNTGSALSMTPSNCSGSTCTWKTTLNLSAGTPLQFKFIKKPGDGGASVTWEGGSNRSYTVPTTSPAGYNGGSWQP